MNFMCCTSCRCCVQQNETGICLACQRGFKGVPQEDAYKISTEDETVPKTLDALKDREAEIENELKKTKKGKKRCTNKT